MTVTDRVKNVIEKHPKSNKKGKENRLAIIEHRGFRGHSISDQQIKPYWDGVNTSTKVSYYS